MNSLIASLRVSLGLDSAAFVSGSKRAAAQVDVLGNRMEKAGFAVGRLTKTLAAGAGILAGSVLISRIKDLAEQGLEYASSLGEVSQQLGVTTGDLQFFRFAASQTGIAQGEMDKGLQKLTRTIGLAANGNKAAQKAFADLGIDIKDATGQLKSAGDVLPEVSGAISRLDGPARQGAAAFALFGKSGQALVPLLAQGKDGIDGLRESYRRLGIELSPEQIAKADDAADKLAALKLVLEAKIAGAVSDNVDSIIALTNALVKLVEWIGKAVQGARELKAAFDSGRFRNFVAFAPLGAVAGGVDLFATARGNALANATRPSVQLTPDTARRFGSGAAAPSPFLAKPARRAPSALLPRLPFDPFTTKFAANDGIGFDAGRNTAALAALNAMAGEAGAATARVVPALAKLDVATATTRDEFEKLSPAVQSLFEQLFPREAAEREYELALKALRGELDRGVISLERFAEARRRLSAASLGLDASDDPGASVFDDPDLLEANLDRVNAGLGKFKGLVDFNADAAEVANVRIVGSFADMAQATIASLNQVAGAVKGGGFLNILSSVIGLGLQLGSVGAFGSKVAGRINAPAGTVPIAGARAMGGPVLGGRAYLVGERGPELMVPGGNGRIVPNNQLGSGGRQQLDIRPSPLFEVYVDGKLVRAAPAIASAGASTAQSRAARAQSRRLVG